MRVWAGRVARGAQATQLVALLGGRGCVCLRVRFVFLISAWVSDFATYRFLKFSFAFKLYLSSWYTMPKKFSFLKGIAISIHAL